eukprot:SM000232S07927  [mRNA]  locus=s232:45317:47227:- [translate_table: standard]
MLGGASLRASIKCKTLNHMQLLVQIKDYHPDVYKGDGNAGAIALHLIKAYELLINENVLRLDTRRRDDPFAEPQELAFDVFVNQPQCIGRGCPYSCIERAPRTFRFDEDTGVACAYTQGRDAEYDVHLAVGQCPQNCIHYVTTEQRLVLEDLLQRVTSGLEPPWQVGGIIDALLSQARFENGRDRSPKRKAKSSADFVDWY